MFIDDERFPGQDLIDRFGEDRIKIVRSSQEAIDFVKDYGCPKFISFDHDLGGDDTAVKFVNWLIEAELDANADGGFVIPAEFSFYVHSQNPIGAQSITNKMQSILTYVYPIHKSAYD